MKHLYFALLSMCATRTFAQTGDYGFQPVVFSEVKLTDHFWLPRIQTNHKVTIPTSFERCEKTGRVKNFEMAAARSGKFCTTYPFDDTDLYKTIEGASFSLSLFPDKQLEAYMDTLIEKIGKAQEPDGYLYTARTIDPLNVGPWVGAKRWEKERELSHELYNAGHLYEAAAAHFQATGKKSLLKIALKNADLVCDVFGPEGLHVAPGHEVVEMGLVKLYRLTGNKKYLTTAKFFIEQRGHYKGYDAKSKDPWKNGAYWQDHIPVAQQREAKGHAVRAGYLYAAVADVAALTNDKILLASIDSIWQNLVSKKLYVQGGAGAIGSGERYGDNYELPNATAYNETCAAIANIFWNQRMFQLHGQAKYIDILEKILYNGFISGVGLDGKSFFYTNAMQVRHRDHLAGLEAQRSGWFECSCCPTNVTRMLPALPGYIYAQKDRSIFVNLFVSSKATIHLGTETVQIEQQNNYPWQGQLRFLITPKNNNSSFDIRIRIPGWAQNRAMPSDLYRFRNTSTGHPVSLTVNGTQTPVKMESGYAVIHRKWRKNDKIEFGLPMEIRRVIADSKLKEDAGKVALQRGPLIYCAEWADNEGKIFNRLLNPTASFQASFRPDLLNGVMVLSTQTEAILIRDNEVHTELQPLLAIPYYSWANRGKGDMRVWLPERIEDIDILSN